MSKRVSASTVPRSWSTLFLAASLAIAPLAAQDSQPEYRLKAAFLSKFPEFTEWPDGALVNRKTIDLCVARPNPFGEVLSDLVTGEAVRGRALLARDIDPNRPIDGCQVLFIPAISASARKELLARVSGAPVLTVGDYPQFLDEGGIINLRVIGGRVKFEINMAAANRARLRLSSQLLKLALSVRGER